MAQEKSKKKAAAVAVGSTTSVMSQVTTVVMLMLENRSLDNVLGFLYANGQSPSSVYPPGSPASFDGASTSNVNYHHDTPYYVTNGTQSGGGASAMVMPANDPGEDFPHVTNQLYADNYGNLPSGDFWQTTPPMTGFAWDYYELFNVSNQGVMGAYNPTQLPAINGLAKNFAVSDRWFSSAPTQTLPNRAFMACGTSLGELTNSEINGSTYANSQTLFNVLGNAGKSWGLYWQSDTIGSGAPLGDVFTQWLCPQINNAPNGVIAPYDDQQNPNSFLQNLAAGTLPNFCFLEPYWGGGPNYIISLQGNDYHPSANVGPADSDLNELYQALINSPQWENMLFIITFDEHGGTYDHVPPTQTVSPDGIAGDDNFQFNRLGVRVPTILISPFVNPGTVFRAPDYQDTSLAQPDFDHTSFIATLCKWAGVDPASAGLGTRVANAPTFEGVLNETPRADKPVLNVPAAYKDLTTGFDPFNEPAPLDGNGKPLPAKSIGFREFRLACDDFKTDPEGFKNQLRKLRYGV